MFSVLVASGLANGLLYALIALGIVVLAKASGAVNFAHGDLVTLGGFVSYLVIVGANLGGAVALVAVIVTALVVGAVVFGVLRRLLEPQYAASLLIATIGVSFICRGVMRLFWGGQGDYLAVPPLTTQPPLIFGDGAVIVPSQQIVIMAGAAVILVLFSLFFRFTRIGLFMRAVADNPRAAHIVGIPGQIVLASAFVLSIATASVAGYLLAPTTLLFPDLGFPLFIKGFAAAMLGGIYSLPGAVVGGLILGLLETFVAGYISSHVQDLSTFVLIFLTLLFLPSGLFATQRKREV
jgi:branched-chain amino acid transport system permease protein